LSDARSLTGSYNPRRLAAHIDGETVLLDVNSSTPQPVTGVLLFGLSLLEALYRSGCDRIDFYTPLFHCYLVALLNPGATESRLATLYFLTGRTKEAAVF